MTPLQFADAIMAYCYRWHHYGASVTSWGRTQARNTRVGGVKNSRHMTWTAGDVGYDPGRFPPLEEARGSADQLGLLLVPERTGSQPHDHLQAK